MTTTKKIIILANSRKMGGTCVAGIELVDGSKPNTLQPCGWIRPIGNDTESGSVTVTERSYLRKGKERLNADRDLQLLDVAKVKLAEHKPETYQSENWRLEPATHWKRLSQVESNFLAHLVHDGPLWRATGQSTDFENNRICKAWVEEETDSLRLIHVTDLKYSVFTQYHSNQEKKRVQAQFSHEGTSYKIAITDLKVEKHYKEQDEGVYEVGPAYLTISLSPLFNGHAYLLAAAVMA